MNNRREINYQLLEEHSTTYSMLPEFIELTNAGKITYIKKQLIMKWFDEHRGRDNACKLNEISSQLGFSKYGNAVNFRALVSSLVVDDGYPIVSCVDGYYKATKRIDIDQNIDTENKRIKGIRKRIEALANIREKFIF